MTTEVQRQGLGMFADLGFTLEHEGATTVCLLHEGELVARFSQTGANEESLQEECARHLMKEVKMDNSKGVTVPDCPLHLTVCFPSCHFWTKNGCGHDAFLAKELENNRAMKESSCLYRPPKK